MDKRLLSLLFILNCVFMYDEPVKCLCWIEILKTWWTILKVKWKNKSISQGEAVFCTDRFYRIWIK